MVTGTGKALEIVTGNDSAAPSLAETSAIATVTAIPTSMANVSVAMSPSSSVAVQVYSVRANSALGAPAMVRLAMSSERPAGNAGLRL